MADVDSDSPGCLSLLLATSMPLVSGGIAAVTMLYVLVVMGPPQKGAPVLIIFLMSAAIGGVTAVKSHPALHGFWSSVFDEQHEDVDSGA